MGYYLKYKWAYNLIAFIILSVNISFAQGVKRQSIGTLGGSVSVDNVTIQSTVGQASITTTDYTETNGVRNGFIQPFRSVVLSDLKQLLVNIYKPFN